MIEGGGLGKVAADDIGPLVDAGGERRGRRRGRRRAHAATVVAKRLIAYFQGATPPGLPPTSAGCASSCPSASGAHTTWSPIIETLCDEHSVTFLRERFAPEMVTALGRIEGRPLGVIANATTHMAGAITSEGADKAARFMQLCDAFGLPLVSLLDTPGMMVGPTPRRRGSCAIAPACSSPARRCASR